MKTLKPHLSTAVSICLTSIITLSGCSAANQKLSSGPTKSTNATTGNNGPVLLNSFDESKDWVHPNSSPYVSGLSSVKTPRVPSAFEQSVRPRQGVACIYVSRGTGVLEHSNPFTKDWTQEIRYNDYSFKINGQTYTVPARYHKQQILVLPIDHGIVWAPVSETPSDLNQVQQALYGATDIYYTPYQAHGGSLANGEQRIAQLPHRWMGIDGPVVATAWSGWLPKNQVAPARVKSDTAYHLQFTQSGQLKSVAPVKGSVPGWPTLFMRDLSKPAYYQEPHYAAFVGSLTRTNGGFVLDVRFMDATRSGRNAGMSQATYYWSEKTGKWTPLAQNYTVQTLGSWTDIGSDGVYWIQPSPIGDGSGSELDVTEMHFDPASLTIESVWLGNWFFGDSLVDGDSWEVVLPDDVPTSGSGQPKKWTVYTP